MTDAHPDDGTKTLDVITIGRASVDLYGQQIGTRLEDIGSFAKSVGGCPTNIAVGTARLGLKSALITRVGNEQMGRFIREQLAREGVETRGIATDPERLTALVLLSVEAEGVSPMIFYRTDCADMALDEGDIDEALHRLGPRHRGHRHAFLASPTAKPRSTRRSGIAKANGAQAWPSTSTTAPTSGALPATTPASSAMSRPTSCRRRYKSVLADCDLIVGTEEEVLIASGEADLLSALKTIRVAVRRRRSSSSAARWAASSMTAPIPDDLEDGIVGKGFPIEVYNVLGAGDAFMCGFLRGWLQRRAARDQRHLGQCLRRLRRVAPAVRAGISDLGRAQLFPRARQHASARCARTPTLNHIHWATNRRRADSRA